MAWKTRFIAVPTGQLKQNDQVMASAKATPEQMRAYMSQVPAVYDKMSAGARAEDFQRMRASGNPQARAIGDAYHHLFSPAGIGHRLEAEIIEGKGLVVTRGRHRIEAAREVDIPYVPVHVRAADERTLDAATRSLENQLQSIDPDVVIAQRYLNAQHREVRSLTAKPSGPDATASMSRADRASRAMDALPAPSQSGPSRVRGRS